MGLVIDVTRKGVAPGRGGPAGRRRPGVHFTAAGDQGDDAGHLTTLYVAAHHLVQVAGPRLGQSAIGHRMFQSGSFAPLL
jgi:hypothetical protein